MNTETFITELQEFASGTDLLPEQRGLLLKVLESGKCAFNDKAVLALANLKDALMEESKLLSSFIGAEKEERNEAEIMSAAESVENAADALIQSFSIN